MADEWMRTLNTGEMMAKPKFWQEPPPSRAQEYLRVLGWIFAILLGLAVVPLLIILVSAIIHAR